MKKEEFIERCDGAPFDYTEVAFDASKVTDDEHVAKVGKAFLAAEKALEKLLEELEIELG